MKTTYNILFLTSILFLASYGDMFDYSIYVVGFEGENKDVNLTNIEKFNVITISDGNLEVETHNF